jgi:hypothetical protein
MPGVKPILARASRRVALEGSGSASRSRRPASGPGQIGPDGSQLMPAREPTGGLRERVPDQLSGVRSEQRSSDCRVPEAQCHRPTGRRVQDAQVNLPGPHVGVLHPAPELRPEEITLTAVKVRATCSEPHSSHFSFAPAEYAAMDIRTSKRAPQF